MYNRSGWGLQLLYLPSMLFLGKKMTNLMMGKTMMNLWSQPEALLQRCTRENNGHKVSQSAIFHWIHAHAIRLVSRLGSSLSTIRPMSSSSPTHAKAPSTSHGSHPTHTLHFPFRQNAIARRARRPGTAELDYQYATPETSSRRTSAAGSEASSEGEVPLPKGFVSHPNLIIPSGEGEAAAHADLKLINDRICKEQQIADVEEQAEILRSAEEQRMRLGKEFVRHKNRDSADLNVDAALREGGSEGDDVIEEQMQTNEAEKRITRKERLAERLMEVFGLEEREQVLEEMKCWLLRSVSE